MNKMNFKKMGIEMTIAGLQSYHEIHYKACFEDVAGRPEFDCICPVKAIINKLQKKLHKEVL